MHYKKWLWAVTTLCPTANCRTRNICSWIFLWLINAKHSDRSAGYHGKSPMELTFHERNEVEASAACCTSFCEKPGRLKCWYLPFQHTKLWSLGLTTALYPNMFSKVEKTQCAAFVQASFFSQMQRATKVSRCKEFAKACGNSWPAQTVRDLSRFPSFLRPDERNA